MPGNSVLSLYHGAGCAIGQPFPSSMCGAFGATYAMKGLLSPLRRKPVIHEMVSFAITDVE